MFFGNATEVAANFAQSLSLGNEVIVEHGDSDITLRNTKNDVEMTFHGVLTQTERTPYRHQAIMFSFVPFIEGFLSLIGLRLDNTHSVGEPYSEVDQLYRHHAARAFHEWTPEIDRKFWSMNPRFTYVVRGI
jgi:hypothetical protein